MSNLFSIFDPSAIMSLPLNWLSALTATIILPMTFWGVSTQLTRSFIETQNYLLKEVGAIVGKEAFPGMLILSMSAFFTIWINNILGLSPYLFTATSHLSFTLALALPLWVGHVVYSWLVTPDNNFSHLVPLGSPGALAPFMVLIELVSAVIRPLTLAVRLAANMLAGHLLLVLLSSPMSSLPLSLASAAMLPLCALAILETAVATIQAYVFSVLSVLYVGEVADKNLH